MIINLNDQKYQLKGAGCSAPLNFVTFNQECVKRGVEASAQDVIDVVRHFPERNRPKAYEQALKLLCTSKSIREILDTLETMWGGF